MANDLDITIKASNPAEKSRIALEYIEAITYLLTIQSSFSFGNEEVEEDDDSKAMFLKKARNLIYGFTSECGAGLGELEEVTRKSQKPAKKKAKLRRTR